jgi:hypothetical protein
MFSYTENESVLQTAYKAGWRDDKSEQARSCGTDRTKFLNVLHKDRGYMSSVLKN